MTVGFAEQRIAREVSEQAEFDLRVVGGEQHMSGLGDEGGADAASEFGAGGNVLQIRIRGGETAGRGAGLAEGCVQASGGWIDENGKSIYISGLELGQLAVVEQNGREWV